MWCCLEHWWITLVNFTYRNPVLVNCVLGVAFGYILLRQWVSGQKVRSKVRLDGKTVIITGANTGIGKETAKELAARGAYIILACRDTVKGSSAAKEIHSLTGQHARVEKLDLASLKSVRTFASKILKEEKRLDILINNAAVCMCPKSQSEEGYEMHFAVNHLGHFLLTNLLLDLLKKSAPSRIINVTSVMNEFARIKFDDINSDSDYSPVGAYNQSKLANILFTHELSHRLHGSGVTVNSLHPGIIFTEISRHLFDFKFPLFIGFLLRTVGMFVYYLVVKTPVQGACTTVHCAVDEGLMEVTGKFFSDCHEVELAEHAKDDFVARKLWDLSVKMVKLDVDKIK